MLQVMVLPSTPLAASGRLVAGKSLKAVPYSLAKGHGKHFVSNKKIRIGMCCLYYETLRYFFPTAQHQSASSINRDLALD